MNYISFPLFFFCFFNSLQSAQSDKPYIQRPFLYWVQEEDLTNIRFSLPKASQAEKDKALHNACAARSCNDLLKKREIIHALIQGGASKTASVRGVDAAQVVRFHQIYYKQKGAYKELLHLVTVYEE